MIFAIISQSLLWGVAATLLVIAPETMLGWFGMPQTPSLSALARLFGSELWGLALVSYFTRNLRYTQQRKGLAVAYVVSNSLGFATTAVSMVQGTMAGATWLLSGLYLIYAVGFAYYLFFDTYQVEGIRLPNSL